MAYPACPAVSLIFFSLQVNFSVTVKAAKCLQEKVTFNIGPLGFNEKLKVLVKTRCECECDNHPGVHQYCNNEGKINCGTCRYAGLPFCSEFLFLIYCYRFNGGIVLMLGILHLPQLADTFIHMVSSVADHRLQCLHCF